MSKFLNIENVSMRFATKKGVFEALKEINLTISEPVRDLGRGLLLAGVIGIPGLGLYAVARALIEANLSR